jgi:hypothetical protein
MEYMVVGSVLGALVIALCALGIVCGCDIEMTFHPPILIRIKVSRVAERQPPSRPRHRPADRQRRRAIQREDDRTERNGETDADAAKRVPKRIRRSSA